MMTPQRAREILKLIDPQRHSGQAVADLARAYLAAMERAERYRKALETLLRESAERTRQHCAEWGEQYGNGTDAEHAARQALQEPRSFKALSALPQDFADLPCEEDEKL